MSTPILSLPLDLTGENPVNKRTGEPHEVTGLVDAIFALNYGPFYTNYGLRVYSQTLGRDLVPNTEFVPLHYYQEPSQRSGLEVCCVIYIKEPSAFGTILVDYQAVGGEFVNMISVIQQLIDNLEIDNRPVNWGDLIGLPDTFPPAAHMHDLGDLYGFEYQTEALEGLRQAILTGDQGSHEEIYLYVDQVIDAVMGGYQGIIDQLNAHEESIDNPHGTNKGHVGLALVANYAPSTRQAAETGTADDLYMTPLMTMYAIAAQALTPLANHIANTNNPHGVDKTDVGLPLVQNYAPATLQEARDGVSQRYMTANINRTLMDEVIAAALDAYSDLPNPTGVTAAQVGLGSVQNFPLATEGEAEDGLRNDRYMTPFLTELAVKALAPVLSFQGRTGNIFLNISDRTNMSLGTTQAVRFGSVTVGNDLAGASAQQLTLFAAGTSSRLRHTDGNITRNYYMPWGQAETNNGSLNIRLLGTEYLKKPYVFANRTLIASGALTHTVNINTVAYQVILANTGTNPLQITIQGNGANQGQPNAGRDKEATDLDDGTNQWAQTTILKINPGNRTVSWVSANWGEAGAPELVPNSWNFISITTELVRHSEDGIHYYGAYSMKHLGGGF